jgi:hypothetical protein
MNDDNFLQWRAVVTEIFFVLTVVFVAYVFCSIINDKKTTIQSVMPLSTTEPEKPVPLPEPIKKEAIKTTPATEVAKPVASPKATVVKKGLKNPSTGEIATSYTNYRFTKRWIKDALVAEGLLEKVYKNNELDAEAEALIKAAIIKLEAIPAYKA